jgi:gamma-glutamylcyclotransferase (GGCT)/AIG2-like uncharacterized protein YtfP
LGHAASLGNEREGAAGRVWLFAYGILREPDTLRAILGYLPPGGATAHVEGYWRRTSADGYYYLVPAPVPAQVLGILWQVTPAELVLLDAVEEVDPADPSCAAGEYRRVRGVAYTAEGAVECWLYLGGTLATWL